MPKGVWCRYCKRAKGKMKYNARERTVCTIKLNYGINQTIHWLFISSHHSSSLPTSIFQLNSCLDSCKNSKTNAPAFGSTCALPITLYTHYTCHSNKTKTQIWTNFADGERKYTMSNGIMRNDYMQKQTSWAANK